ncbi:MAG: hypothetical protein JWO62_2280 [Acidimicrobiaceae bacterium]|nr:hypothetical protein [Acidimicrobiaceae bacterium]
MCSILRSSMMCRIAHIGRVCGILRMESTCAMPHISDQHGHEITRGGSVLIRTNYQLGAIIKGQRQTLGMTQSELARRAEVSLRTIVEIESGDGNPRFKSLLRCLDTLDLDISAEPRDHAADEATESLLRSVLSRTKER